MGVCGWVVGRGVIVCTQKQIEPHVPHVPT